MQIPTREYQCCASTFLLVWHYEMVYISLSGWGNPTYEDKNFLSERFAFQSIS